MSIADAENNYGAVTQVPGSGWNVTEDPRALRLPTNVWTVPVNGYISPVLVLFTLTTNAVVCAVLLRPGGLLFLTYSAGARDKQLTY